MVGLDAKFLYSETPATHMHTLKVAVFDMSNLPRGYSYDEITDLLGHRLNRLPPFRRRAVPVPLGLGHPVWVEDPEFDLARHITCRRAAEPGDDEALAVVVADIAGTPLPRDRPLWEIVVVEGLADSRLAVVAKVHHAVADGAATVALLLNALSANGTGSPVDEWHSEMHPHAFPAAAAGCARPLDTSAAAASIGDAVGAGSARVRIPTARFTDQAAPAVRHAEDGVQRVAHPGADLSP